jgi:hypothetical protein
MGGGSYPKAAPSFGDFEDTTLQQDQDEYGFEEEYQENDNEPFWLEELSDNL